MHRFSTSRLACSAIAALAASGWHTAASAQANDPFIGQIMCAAFNFAPQGWAELNGQLLSIQQNTALFSLLGTTYGGNGTTTFALPDMRARVLIHAGQGPGLSSRVQGEAGGAEQVTLTNGTTLYAPGPGTVAMTPLLTSPAGSNAPVSVVQPFVTVKCFIALFGVFPSRP